MVDTTGWSVRNKANPYFAKANHVKLAKNQATKRFIDSVVDQFLVIRALLFSDDEPGFLIPVDADNCFTDIAGTTLAQPGQGVALALDKGPNELNWTQATEAARPVLEQFDTDKLRLHVGSSADPRFMNAAIPTGGIQGTMVLATDEGTAAYKVNIPAGNYPIGLRSSAYFPGSKLVGQTVTGKDLNASEISLTRKFFISKGAGDNYGDVTSFFRYWRDWTEIVQFPLIDTSSGTNFFAAWQDCSSLTSFPLIDTSSGTNFFAAWQDCSSLTSFPLIDTSSGTFFGRAWQDCSSLTSFPLIDTSSGTSFFAAWQGCSSLTSFPANFFDGCATTFFNFAFENTSLSQTSIDGILVSLNSNNTSNGTFNQSGGSAPSATGEAAIDAMRSRGWTITVTGGY